VCYSSGQLILATVLIVKLIIVEVIICKTIVARAVVHKPAVTEPTIAWVPVVIAWVPVVIAKVRLVWISVHEPVPFEVVEVVHAERTTVVVSRVASVEVVVVVKTNGIPPRHGVPSAERIRPAARGETVPITLVEGVVVEAVHVTSSKASSAKEPVVVFSVVEVAVVALVVEAFVVVPSERQRPAPTAELLTVGSS